MKKMLALFLMCFLGLNFSAHATLTATYVPVTKVGGSSPTVQNGSIVDTGTSSGPGNVGIGSPNPGQALDVNGTVRATGFVAGGSGITLGGVNNTSWPSGSSQWTGTSNLYFNGNVGINTTTAPTKAGLQVGIAPGVASTIQSSSNADDQIYNVKSPKYGAKGDGIHLLDGACNTGASTAFSSATAVFTAGDVGKVITMTGAGAAGIDLTTTIADYVDANDVTLTTGCSTTISGKDFTYGTDDTTPIQNAINDVGTNKMGTVYFPAGIYVVNGAYQNTSQENSQLILPEVSMGATIQNVTLKGAYKRPTAGFSAWTTPPDQGSIIFCTRVGSSAAQSCLSGWDSYTFGIGNHWDGISLYIDRLNFRVVTNPSNSVLNFAAVAQVTIRDSNIDTAAWTAYTVATQAGSTGIILPLPQNFGNQQISNVHVQDFYVGIQSSEHADLDSVYLNYDRTGLVVTGASGQSTPWHPTHVTYAVIQNFVYGIRFITGQSNIVANDIDFETLGSGGFTTVDMIYDPNNYGYGKINWLAYSNTTLSINGGSNLIIHQNNLSDTGNYATLGNIGAGIASPTKPLQVVGAASFDGTGNVSIGSVTPGGMLDVEGNVSPVIFGGVSNGTTFKNVGIGTFSPGYMLDVAGGARFNGSGNSLINSTGGNVGIGTTIQDGFVTIGGGAHGVASTTVGRVMCTGLTTLGAACWGYCTSISTDTCACTCF